MSISIETSYDKMESTWIRRKWPKKKTQNKTNKQTTTTTNKQTKNKQKTLIKYYKSWRLLDQIVALYHFNENECQGRQNRPMELFKKNHKIEIFIDFGQNVFLQA